MNERLREGLLKYHRRESPLRLLENSSIPPTNNAVECVLHSGILGRMVSQCSKTW